MCLVVNQQKPAPTKRFCVWKVITVNDEGRLRTPHRAYPVTVGVLSPAESLTKPVAPGTRLNEGCIHAHATRKRALRAVDDETIVVRCFVSPLEFIAYGGYEDLAVSCLRITAAAVAKGLAELGSRIRNNRKLQIKRIQKESKASLKRLAAAKKALAK